VEEPAAIKILRAKLAKTESKVDERRKYLHLDDTFTFKSKVEQFSDRPLRFRKLRFGEVTQIQALVPSDIEEGKPVSPEDQKKIFEAACTALVAATRDSFSIQDFRDLEPIFVIEAFKWLVDLSGFSEEAVDDLAWFRGKSGGASAR
jgi:hypothetical protein